jgi:hypothetical protein
MKPIQYTLYKLYLHDKLRLDAIAKQSISTKHVSKQVHHSSFSFEFVGREEEYVRYLVSTTDDYAVLSFLLDYYLR